MSGFDEIPTQDEYENALKGDMEVNKKTMKLGELNELASEDVILSINTSSSIGKVAFELVTNAKNSIFCMGNYKNVCGRLVSKYALHTALSLSKLKSELHNSKLESIEKDPDEWILNLEGVQF